MVITRYDHEREDLPTHHGNILRRGVGQLRHRPSLLQYPQGHWDLPKGHVEPDDEDRQRTMLRELKEETGIADVTVLEGFEERTEYAYRHKGKRREKEVFWYVAETEELDVVLSHEHRGYLWLDWDQALETISHDETRSIVERARQFVLANGRQ